MEIALPKYYYYYYYCCCCYYYYYYYYYYYVQVSQYVCVFAVLDKEIN